MKRIGIIGAGRFGSTLAEELSHHGVEVLLMERDGAIVQRMADGVGKAVQGDATDAEALAAAGFQECDAAVVAIGDNLESSVLATMNLKDLKIPHVVAKAVSDLHGKVLERVGADLVLYPDRERAQRLAHALAAGSALDYFEISAGVSVAEMKAPACFVGKTLMESGIRKRYGATILAIKRPAGNGTTDRIVSPTGDDVIRAGDSLVVFGANEGLEALCRTTDAP